VELNKKPNAHTLDPYSFFDNLSILKTRRIYKWEVVFKYGVKRHLGRIL